jgi:hypothetical protein
MLGKEYVGVSVTELDWPSVTIVEGEATALCARLAFDKAVAWLFASSGPIKPDVLSGDMVVINGMKSVPANA